MPLTHCAVVLVLSPMWLTAAHAQASQAYVNADGSVSADLAAAAATWAADPEFKGNYGQGAMNAQFAYARGFTGKGIELGAVDSGVKSSHPEFSNRQVNGITLNLISNEGTYLNDGANIPDPLSNPWTAGMSFGITGEYTPPQNDNHGSHVSGTIAAARNGTTAGSGTTVLGMMGVAFNSNYSLSNTNGNDSAIYGPNVDYNFFKAAYRKLAERGVRAINSSWGSPGLTSTTDTIPLAVRVYSRYFLLAGKKTWLQGVAEVTRDNPVLQVFAAGNTRFANVNIRSSLPFFEPDLESKWIAVPATTSTNAMASFSNKCGLAKYWCISAPGNGINSLSVSTATGYKSSNGTSMAAPHVTGALGLLMERYPSLSNEAIRTILLTTAKYLGTGDPEVPEVKFGWGIPDLNKAMSGPGQLLGTFEANLAAGLSDEWSNPISQTAMQQRKLDEAAEIAAWPGNKASLLAAKNQETSAPPPADWVSNMANLLGLMTKMVQAAEAQTGQEIVLNSDALRASPYGERMYQQLVLSYGASPDSWTMARLNALTGGLTGSNLASRIIKMENDVLETAVAAWEKRIKVLQAKTAADYASNLIKSGAGVLILSGANTYTGSTEVREGTLKTGLATALLNSPVKVAVGATLDITGSGSATVAGITNAGIITLSDGVTGQVLNVNGPWDGQQGIVKLDTTVISPPARSGGVVSQAATVVSDKLVITGAVSGTTLLSLAGNINPTQLVGVPLIQSTQPIPSGSFVLSTPITSGGQSFVLSIVNDTVTLAVAPPVKPPVPAAVQAVPTLQAWGLGVISALLAGLAAFFTRRNSTKAA